MAVHNVRLVRVTIATPTRRMDLALPEDAVVAEIIPGLITRAGEELADQGIGHGGWVLRRFDGTPLENARTLAANRLRDGELLRMAPRRLDWPELEYDDLVYAIAGGARKHRQRWTPRHTRLAGLGFGGAVVLLGLLAVATSGPDWATPARWAFGQAALLLLAGTVLSRVVGDSVAGAVAGLLALPYAFVAGAASQGGDLALSAFGAPQLLVGCAALTVAGLVGYVGVADGTWLFAAGVATGLFGLAGCWLASQFRLPADHVGAVLVGALLPLSPLLASAAIRLGKLPLPVLPRTTADLLRDDPQPPRDAVYHAVQRSDDLLTGMLAGASTVCGISLILLLGSENGIAHILGLIGSAGWLVRARLYPVVRQRAPLLAAGLTGPAAALYWMGSSEGGLTAGGSGLVAFGFVVVAIGVVYSQRTTSPYLRRMTEFLEILLILSVVPLAVWVLGLYSKMAG